MPAPKPSRSSATPARRPGPARRSWKQDPEGRRERILTAAEAEIRRHGVQALRTGAVARRARVAEGTLFHLFGSKAGLLEEVGRRYGEGLARAAFGGDTPTGGNVDVEAIIGGIFDYVRANRPQFEAFLWGQDPAAEEAGSALREQMVAAVCRQLEFGIAEGGLPAMNPRRAAEIQYAMVEGSARDCFVRGQGEDEAEYREELIRSLRAMLGQTANENS